MEPLKFTQEKMCLRYEFVSKSEYSLSWGEINYKRGMSSWLVYPNLVWTGITQEKRGKDYVCEKNVDRAWRGYLYQKGTKCIT